MMKYSTTNILAFGGVLLSIAFCGCSFLDSNDSVELSVQTDGHSEIPSIQQTSNTNLTTGTSVNTTRTSAETDDTTDTVTLITTIIQHSAPDGTNIVKATSDGIRLKLNFSDKNGTPVQNLKVELSPVDDIKFDYTPHFSTSDIFGDSTGEAVLGNYKVIVQDADETTLYSEMTFDLIISADNTDYNFVWEHITPQERMASNGNSIRFVITDGGEPLANASIELYVGHHEVHDFWTNNPPEMVELGSTNSNGIVFWSMPELGEYTLYTYVLKDGQKTKVAKQFVVDGITSDYKFDF